MDLYLRKVRHPTAVDNYRVILKRDGEDIEIGSIGVQHGTEGATVWAWGIDTVIPMRAIEAEGSGADRADCARRFRVAWESFTADQANLTLFLAQKRRERQGNR